MNTKHFKLFAALAVSVLALGACGSPSGPSNPYVGNIPSLQVQWEQELDRLDTKFNSSKHSDYDKYQADKKKINYQYGEKIEAEKQKLIGKTIPCSSLSDACSVVNDEAVCVEGSNYLMYRAMVTFNKTVHILGELLVWDVFYLDSNGGHLQEGKQTMSPRDGEVSLSHDFVPGKTYQLSIVFTSYGSDRELFQKEFSSLAIQPAP